ncbi:uncharacterized protein N7529_002918 [Penicillium soppii]|uniref:uncharacterized protein n=1 Tax=Penicillium soppii TaxID=69789 RepID=UPI002546CF19|nr:uncharacterized protein N7529_002918 [Penicillium soppii]KAJ5874488.1 hypothetical protein N7529_002918 [Penicillium soppii]
MSFVDHLIHELSHTPFANSKQLMLTLHCLFPNDFLPALDILDRKLVRMVRVGTRTEDIFLVTSTSPPSRKSASSHQQDKSYEVRLRAWNCSCPTFALSAYRDQPPVTDDQPSTTEGEHVNYPFGGTLTRDTTRSLSPVCKHILACILHARCPDLFGGDSMFVVSMEELAGWCAGWGG